MYMRPLLVLACAGGLALGQTPVAEIDIGGGNGAAGNWIDSGIDLRAGDMVIISASGSLTLTQGKQTKKLTPAGASRGFRDLLKAYPLNEAGAGALIARFGSSDTAQPFLIGERKELKAIRSGRLFLSMNLTSRDTVEGSFHARIEITERGPENVAPISDDRLPRVTSEMMERIPRRVEDAQGNAGDNTNFLVIGDEQDVIAAFMAAGWVKVDRGKPDAVIHGLLSVLTKQAYVELPMTELILFARVQHSLLPPPNPIPLFPPRHH